MLSRFKLFQEATQDKHTSLKLDSYKEIVRRYKILEPRLRELDITDAVHYNIFEIMKLNYREVELHTPVLSNLLNPKGSHAQGDLFLRRFIETVFDGDDKVRFASVDLNRVSVQDEWHSGNGQIDILVQYKGVGDSYLWIIENKISAGDQDGQLNRYFKVARSWTGFDENNIRLLYLKPIKSNPSESSLDRDSFDVLSKTGVLKMISYDKHILPWLNNCLEEIQAPIVKYTIMQYIRTLKTICS